jgi:hypothetical protein
MTSKILIIAASLVLTALAGCTGPADGGDESGDSQVAFYVKDAPSDEFDGVFVSFTKVEVHKTGGGDGVESGENATATTSAANTTAATNTTATTAPTVATNATSSTNATAANTTSTSGAASEAGWITLVSGNQTVDLKAFQGDAKAFLGEANITAGKYTQIRITVSQAYGTKNGTQTNFTLPSGKLKLTGPWEATEGQATQLIVDFQLEKSIHKAGSKYMFKPTMKLIVEKKDKLSASDTEDASMAATRTKSTSHGKPTDKGKPTNSTSST